MKSFKTHFKKTNGNRRLLNNWNRCSLEFKTNHSFVFGFKWFQSFKTRAFLIGRPLTAPVDQILRINRKTYYVDGKGSQGGKGGKVIIYLNFMKAQNGRLKRITYKLGLFSWRKTTCLYATGFYSERRNTAGDGKIRVVKVRTANRPFQMAVFKIKHFTHRRQCKVSVLYIDGLFYYSIAFHVVHYYCYLFV